MKVSIVSTVLNEGKNIGFFIESLLSQSIEPDEIIVVDGGSTDETYRILKEISKNNDALKVFQKRGFNISQGRNYAISKSKNKIVVTVDAGTKYEENWLKNLTKHFSGDVGFGKTLPLINSNFQKILAKKMRQRFGSARNMIIKKSAWKKVGGYPEDMKIAEDSVFYARLKNQGFKFCLIPEAIGYWEMRGSLKDLRKQFYNYGYWGGIGYRKYKILNFRRKVAILFLTLTVPLYPILWLFSKFSLSVRMSLVMRYGYLRGFYRGLFE